MSTTSTPGRSAAGTATPNLVSLTRAATGAAVATSVNAAIWITGRAADVSFSVTPAFTDTEYDVDIASVIATTFGMFALAVGVLALAVRRSDRWARAVLVAAGLVAVLSVGGPLATANDTASGVLLAAMHLVTAAVFLVTASKVARRA